MNISTTSSEIIPAFRRPRNWLSWDFLPNLYCSFREQTRKAAEDGTGSPLFARLVAAGRSGQTNRSFGTSQIDREGLTIDTGTPQRSGGGGGFFQGPRSESQRKIINDIIKQLLQETFASKPKLIDANMKAIMLGYEYAQDNFTCPLINDRHC